MKTVSVILFVSFLLLASFLPALAGTEELKTSLDQIIDKSVTKGYGLHYDWLDEHLKAWPGLRTMEGAQVLYDYWFEAVAEYEDAKKAGLWEKPDTTREDMVLAEKGRACSAISEKLLVPRERIVTYLLDNLSSCELIDQMKRLGYLEPYFNDLRVPGYLASLLGDKRVIREGSLASGYRVRVCDNASTLLLRCYEKAGLLKRGEGGIVGDTLNQSDFDQNIAALRPYLIQQGVIAADAPYPPQPGRTRPGGGLATTATPRVGKRPAPAGTGDPADDTPGAGTWRWLRWLGLLLVAAALLWLAFGKRRTSRQGG